MGLLNRARGTIDIICRLDEAETRLAALAGTDYAGMVEGVIEHQKNVWGTRKIIEKIEWITRMIEKYGDCVKWNALIAVEQGTEKCMEMLLEQYPNEVQKLKDMEEERDKKCQPDA